MTGRDTVHRRLSQALEKVGLGRGWFGELSAYYRGMTMQEFWVRYTVLRMEAAKLWDTKPRSGEADYRSFFAETDYYVLRQMFYHRHSSFHWVADALRAVGPEGDCCEYGSGVGPVTAWLRPRFPRWRFTLVDLPVPTLEFARWRFRAAGNVEFLEPGFGRELPLQRAYDVITILEVLEHVVNPLDVVRHLVAHLKPGGTLFLNFSDDAGRENLVESAAERGAVLAFLHESLEPVVPLRGDESYARYVKPRGAAPGRARTP
jgi:SAM-dependent methyltransferase